MFKIVTNLVVQIIYFFFKALAFQLIRQALDFRLSFQTR